ncbi:MAG: NfeD family protein [Rectinemataceae bacterium]
MFGPWFWWALLGLILIGAETFIPGLAIIFFGLGALATAMLCVFPFFASSPAFQALFWTATSLASLIFLRKPFKRLLKGSAFYRDGESKVDTVAGETAVVTDRIRPDYPGRVHFRGTSWKAVAYLESLDPGETVRVVSREGLNLIVTRDFLDPENLAIPDSSNFKEDTR